MEDSHTIYHQKHFYIHSTVECSHFLSLLANYAVTNNKRWPYRSGSSLVSTTFSMACSQSTSNILTELCSSASTELQRNKPPLSAFCVVKNYSLTHSLTLSMTFYTTNALHFRWVCSQLRNSFLFHIYMSTGCGQKSSPIDLFLRFSQHWL